MSIQPNTTRIIVAALYKFVSLPDYQQLQGPLLECCQAHGIKGTLLLAAEGINGTIAGKRQAVDAVLAYLKSDQRFYDLQHKESQATAVPFLRMKVRLKKEIVSMGVADVDPGALTGTYVEPQDWNALITDPDVLVIDTRNRYECQIGTFENAINPDTDHFREFPNYVKDKLDPGKHKKVAMFCTGGIRCEKASSYMLSQGFEEVFHLKGGILNYLEQTPSVQSKWNGECFVFDDRVAVDHGLLEGSYDQCHACRHPISVQDQESELYQPGVSCPHCHGKRSAEQIATASERHKQMQLAKQRKQKHLGAAINKPKRTKP